MLALSRYSETHAGREDPHAAEKADREAERTLKRTGMKPGYQKGKGYIADADNPDVQFDKEVKADEAWNKRFKRGHDQMGTGVMPRYPGTPPPEGNRAPDVRTRVQLHRPEESVNPRATGNETSSQIKSIEARNAAAYRPSDTVVVPNNSPTDVNSPAVQTALDSVSGVSTSPSQVAAIGAKYATPGHDWQHSLVTANPAIGVLNSPENIAFRTAYQAAHKTAGTDPATGAIPQGFDPQTYARHEGTAPTAPVASVPATGAIPSTPSFDPNRLPAYQPLLEQFAAAPTPPTPTTSAPITPAAAPTPDPRITKIFQPQSDPNAPTAMQSHTPLRTIIGNGAKKVFGAINNELNPLAAKNKPRTPALAAY